MARKKKTEDAPEQAPQRAEMISLCRPEARTERVPITDEQRTERLAVAAGTVREAEALDMEAASLKEQLKGVKERANAKHREAERIVLDAHQGTVAREYPVIVERHPTRPLQMIVWRVPEGIAIEEILHLEEQGEARIAAREAQGCTIADERAMFADEIEAAGAIDHKAKNPELPLEGIGAQIDEGAVAVEGAAPAETLAEDVETTADDPAAADEPDTARAGEAEAEATTEGAGEEEQAGKEPSPAVLARVGGVLANLGGEHLTMAELAEKTGHHADDIRPALDRLIAEGRAIKVGKARGTRYGKGTPVDGSTVAEL